MARTPPRDRRQRNRHLLAVHIFKRLGLLGLWLVDPLSIEPVPWYERVTKIRPGRRIVLLRPHTRIEKKRRRVRNAMHTYNYLKQLGYPEKLLIEGAREYLGIE